MRAASDAQGSVRGRLNYGPFGDVLPGAATGEPQFAGHGFEPGASLIFMGARTYDPRIARFQGPDPVVPTQLLTQALNRYAYVFNDPLSFVDPSGHQANDISTGYGTSPLPVSGGDFWSDPRYAATFTPTVARPTVSAFGPGGTPAPGLDRPANSPPTVAHRVTGASLAARMRTLGIAQVPVPPSDLPAISETDIANFQAQAFTGRGPCPTCHYYVPPGEMMVPVSPELKAWSAAMMITSMAVPLVKASEVVAGGVALTPSIWLYARAPVFWDFLLAAGNAMLGVPRVGLPRLTPGAPADMLREGLQLLRNIPPAERQQAFRQILQQIARNSTDPEWSAAEFSYNGGSIWIGTLQRPAVFIDQLGNVTIGTGSPTYDVQRPIEQILQTWSWDRIFFRF